MSVIFGREKKAPTAAQINHLFRAYTNLKEIGPYMRNEGICANLRKYMPIVAPDVGISLRDWQQDQYSTWQYFSGSLSFPVSHNIYTEHEAYQSLLDLWIISSTMAHEDIVYVLRRYDLLDHLISCAWRDTK